MNKPQKIKTQWNLGLLYKGDNDPQIEKDMKAIETACAAFEKKYKPKAGKAAEFTRSPKRLAAAYAEHQKLSKNFGSAKPVWYFELKKDLDSDNPKVSAMRTKFDERWTEASNKLTFFTLEIGKIAEKDREKFLKSRELAPYAYSLRQRWKFASHQLSEGEEQLADLLGQTSYSMWVSVREKILNKQMIEHRGKQIPFTKATRILAELPKMERREMNKKLNEVRKLVADVAEAEINAVYNYKKTMDKRRGYKRAYDATILHYENEEKSVLTLASLVTQHFTVAHRFYALQAKLNKEKNITYADRNAKIGEIKTAFTFDASTKIFSEVLREFDPEYVKIFEDFLVQGQIDVYPKKGKHGGAYCSNRTGLPTFVLLNHADSTDDAETLAHEMGHAFHSEFSRVQPPRYEHYSMAVAETASTFFEQMMSEAIEVKLPENEKLIMLSARINGDMQTIFRQIALFNFEVELHEKIRAEGEVSKEVMAALLAKHLRAYLGPAVLVADDDGYSFVDWPHIRYFFYVYSYAYGQLVSRALFEKWKQDKSYATKIKQFLSAGRSMSPEDIFRSVGIDTSKPAFFEAGLKSIERDVERLEKMTKSMTKGK